MTRQRIFDEVDALDREELVNLANELDINFDEDDESYLLRDWCVQEIDERQAQAAWEDRISC